MKQETKSNNRKMINRKDKKINRKMKTPVKQIKLSQPNKGEKNKRIKQDWE